MQTKLLEVLACPKCLCALDCRAAEQEADGEIVSGTLTCPECKQEYPVTSGIPRFVPQENYASSFGYQWNRFRLEQLDSVNGTGLSARRFYTETGWTDEWMKGKWLLDAGCGAGRFLDVSSKSEAEVVGMDISNAIDASKANLKGRRNVHFVQASIYELPFRTGAFDGCYCLGVLQHTPDPAKATRSLPRILKAGGRIAVTIYERKRWTPLYSKYLIRHATKRLNKDVLLKLIKGSMPVMFPVTEVVFRLPLIGRLFMFTIPIANYVNERKLSWRQRYDWAVLDTFDMLSPQYDQPQTQAEAEGALKSEGIGEIERLNNPGLNLVGRKVAGELKEPGQ